MRIAVMGTGGTGGYFGGLLARAGEEVTFIARGAHLEAIQKNGLAIKSVLAGDFTISAKATDNPNDIGPVDCVLFCVKAYDNAVAAEQIRPLIGPETVVLSVQNGIDNEEQIGNVVGPEHVVGCASYVSSTIESPGVIAQTGGPGKIVFGEMQGGTSPRTETLQSTLQNSGIATELHSDIQAALWQKFLGICGVNGVTALTRLPMGEILACEETRNLMRGTMEEVEAIGRAMGAELPDGCVDQSMDFFSSLEPSIRGSMYYDLAAGRRLELDVLNGTVVRLGSEHGIPTPTNFAIYAALKPYLNGEPSSL
ncbi:MAG: 2-dehydropantoate 2-reductase [Desulfobacterales bacterium]|jgi:2-dehydropantoate 2-reductase